MIQGGNDPIVINSDSYEDEWYRRQEMKVSSTFASGIDSYDINSDFKDLIEEKEIPVGYSVVIGSSFVSSSRSFAPLPSVDVQEGKSRYTSATVFRHAATGKRFVMSGPRTHVYLVPSGEYEIIGI